MLYKLALFVHVAGVIGMFIAVGVTVTAMGRMRRAGTVAGVRMWAELAVAIERAIPAALVVLLLPGLYMVNKVWGWDTPWAMTTLAALIVISVLGPSINERRIRAIDRAAAQAGDGPVPPSLAARIGDPVLWLSLHTITTVMVGIVWLMTVKPGLTGSLLAMAISVVAGVGAAMPSIQRARATGREIAA